MDIKEISKNIKTQNNRITDQPLFLVQREVTDWGIDSGYSDYYKWINADNDYQEADDEKIEELETLDYNCEDTGGFEKHYYLKRWEFVTACFTEKGCQRYLELNGHNLGKTRIYADGSYRNEEYQEVRKFLISQTGEAE